MAPAAYARILDGETLWLALEADVTTVTLRTPAAS